MAKKKLLEKPPIPLGIKPHDGERSPHILNLRQISPGSTAQQKNDVPTNPLSFEQRVAVFDERVKDIPDFLRTHAEYFSKLVDDQKNNWQETFSSFLQKAGAIGQRVEREITQTARLTRKRISRKSPSLLSRLLLPSLPALPLPHWTRHKDIGLFICLLILLTIPLQGILIYHAVQTTKTALQTNLAGLRLHGGEFLEALREQDLEDAHRELQVSLDHIKKIRGTVSKFGPLRALLPERFRVG